MTDYGLIETFRWERGAYVLRAEHRDRLARSAARLGFACDMPAIDAQLDTTAATLDGPSMVRLVLARDGHAAITVKPMPPALPEWRFVISPTRIDPSDPLLFHKTTRRDLYDGEHAAFTTSGACEEVVYLNKRGELAEGGRTNIFLEQPGGLLLTPALESGLLPGTLRASLLAAGKARETVMGEADLARAARVFLGNAVRGLIPARKVVLSPPGG